MESEEPRDDILDLLNLRERSDTEPHLGLQSLCCDRLITLDGGSISWLVEVRPCRSGISFLNALNKELMDVCGDTIDGRRGS